MKTTVPAPRPAAGAKPYVTKAELDAELARLLEEFKQTLKKDLMAAHKRQQRQAQASPPKQRRRGK